ncbi:MAG: hypothetical protein MJ246_02660 [Clostridia bacterium]|nr:hypothetical protein [Clostridia bacterium]
MFTSTLIPNLASTACDFSMFAGRLFLNSTAESLTAGTRYTTASVIKLIAIR